MITEISWHKVRCGNIMDDISELFTDGLADIMYSDPPWGKGALGYWQTLNTKMTGAAPIEIDYLKFIDRIFEVAHKYTKQGAPVFIEYGCNWNKELVEVALAHDLMLQRQIEMVYGSPERPLILNIFTNGESDLKFDDEYAASVYHTKGYKSITKAVTPYAKEGMVILDPMCGMGYTARFAVDHGLMFRGNEINSARLQKTIYKLEKTK